MQPCLLCSCSTHQIIPFSFCIWEGWKSWGSPQRNAGQWKEEVLLLWHQFSIFPASHKSVQGNLTGLWVYRQGEGNKFFFLAPQSKKRVILPFTTGFKISMGPMCFYSISWPPEIIACRIQMLRTTEMTLETESYGNPCSKLIDIMIKAQY